MHVEGRQARLPSVLQAPCSPNTVASPSNGQEAMGTEMAHQRQRVASGLFKAAPGESTLQKARIAHPAEFRARSERLLNAVMRLLADEVLASRERVQRTSPQPAPPPLFPGPSQAISTQGCSWAPQPALLRAHGGCAGAAWGRGQSRRGQASGLGERL